MAACMEIYVEYNSLHAREIHATSRTVDGTIPGPTRRYRCAFMAVPLCTVHLLYDPFLLVKNNKILQLNNHEALDEINQ
jgi:hypothetical protein